MYRNALKLLYPELKLTPGRNHQPSALLCAPNPLDSVESHVGTWTIQGGHLNFRSEMRNLALFLGRRVVLLPNGMAGIGYPTKVLKQPWESRASMDPKLQLRGTKIYLLHSQMVTHAAHSLNSQTRKAQVSCAKLLITLLVFLLLLLLLLNLRFIGKYIKIDI